MKKLCHMALVLHEELRAVTRRLPLKLIHHDEFLPQFNIFDSASSLLIIICACNCFYSCILIVTLRNISILILVRYIVRGLSILKVSTVHKCKVTYSMKIVVIYIILLPV